MEGGTSLAACGRGNSLAVGGINQYWSTGLVGGWGGGEKRLLMRGQC